MNPSEQSEPEKNPYLWNRKGHTPFDELDSLDRLELALQKEEEEERLKLNQERFLSGVHETSNPHE